MSKLNEEFVLESLKIDLAFRKDNKYVGSGLGGNPSEFFYMQLCADGNSRKEENDNYSK